MRTKALPLSVRAGAPLNRPHRPAARSSRGSNAFAAWLGTLIMAILPIALIVPMLIVTATPTPTLAVSPQQTTAGSLVTISGQAFPLRAQGQITLDGASKGFPKFKADAAGAFAVELIVPTDAAPGDHTVSAVVHGSGRGSGEATLLAAPVIVIRIVDAVPIPVPTVLPTPISASTATASPTLVPTVAPTPTTPEVAPTLAPTPNPAVAATLAPTLAPTPTPPHHQPDPLTCAGYPEPRVFLEAQGWWKGDGVASKVGSDAPVGAHVHVGTCFPWGEAVSGVVDFDVRIMLHDNPGELYRLRPQVWYDGGDSVQNEVYYRQSYDARDTTIWQSVAIDTTRIPFDGLQEMRFFTEVRHSDGADQYSSTGWQMLVANGNPVNHYKPDAQASEFTEGRGWYDGEAGYTNARWEELALNHPVSGVWSPDLKMTAGSGGASVTSHGVYIDPNFHAGSQGTIVKSGLGKWDGPVTIDTRTLSNGWHKLVLRADAAVIDGTNSGLIVIPFMVRN